MYPPQHTGGYEIVWQQAMHETRSRGHHVRVLATGHVEDPARPEGDPYVHRELRWYWDPHTYRFPDLTAAGRLALERHNARVLERHLREFDPDLVAWWSMGCMSLSLIERVRRRGRPAVFVAHDDWVGYGFEHDQWTRMWTGPRRRRLGRVVERLCGIPTAVDVGRAGPFVFNSEFIRRRALGEHGIRPRWSEVVHPGIEDELLERFAPRSDWEWRLACIGRIDRQKGIDTAVEALAHLPAEATLDVWGTGEAAYVAEMEALAARLGVGDRVRFRGFAAGEARVRAYLEADCVLFPVRWEEPFGLVPLEAMALGRPVTATARGGTAEFLRDRENAIVFGAGDAAALAAAVRLLGGDAGLRERLVTGGRRTGERFTATDATSRTVDAMLAALARTA